LRYKHLFSFLESNASIDTLLEQVRPWLKAPESEAEEAVAASA
jgi:hypothetical protein